jgi:mannose-6-phosphate isomerase-like protein (cupin superfamily)
MVKWVLGHKIAPLTVTGDFDMVMGETPPNMQGPPPHHHNNFHEVFIVTEGEMVFIINGETSVIRTGESINLSPKTIHTFSNNSQETCKWINIHSPKGFLRFFENLGISENEESAEIRSLSPEIIHKVMETAPNYDMIISKT